MHAKLIAGVAAIVLGASALASAADTITIRMYGGYDLNTEQSKVLDGYLRQYEAAHPNVKVENLGRNLDVDKLVNLFISGEAPDIIEIDAKFLGQFYRSGLLAEVPPDVEQQVKNVLFPASVQFLTVAGHMIGIPGENQVTGLWYSRQALDAAGLGSLPKTVDELVADSKRLTKVAADGKLQEPGMALIADWATNHLALAMLTADGGRVFDAAGNIALDAPPLRSTVARLSDWLNPTNLFFAKSGFDDDFVRGDVGFGFGYPWWLGGIKGNFKGDYNKNFAVTTFPGGAGFGTFHYGHGYGVNKNTKHPEEVWKLLSWLALQPVDGVTPLGHVLAVVGSLPNVRQDITSAPFAEARPFYEGFIDNLQYAVNTPDWELADIGAAASEVAAGKSNPASAATEVLVKLKAAVDKQRDWEKSHSAK